VALQVSPVHLVQLVHRDQLGLRDPKELQDLQVLLDLREQQAVRVLLERMVLLVLVGCPVQMEHQERQGQLVPLEIVDL